MTSVPDDKGAGNFGGAVGTTAPPCTLAPTLNQPLTVAPAADGQGFVRCETLGGDGLWQVLLAPEGDRLAARTSTGTVRLLDGTGASEIAHLAAPLGSFEAMAFSPDGAWLATLAPESGQLVLWNARDGALGRAFTGPPGPLLDVRSWSVAFSPDGAWVAASNGLAVEVATGATIDWRTGSPIAVGLQRNPENLDAGEEMPVMRFFATGNGLFSERRFGVGNSPPTAVLSVNYMDGGHELDLFHAYDRNLRGYALSPDGCCLAMSGIAADNDAFLGLSVFYLPTGTPVAGNTSLTGMPIAVASKLGRIVLLDGDTWEVRYSGSLEKVAELAVPPGIALKSLGLAPDGTLVLSGGGTTTFWSLETGAMVRSFSAAVTQISWDKTGTHAAATGDGALFHLWTIDGSAIHDSCAAAPVNEPVDLSAYEPPLSTARFVVSNEKVQVGADTVVRAATSPDGSLIAGTISDPWTGGFFGVWRPADATRLWAVASSSTLASVDFAARGSLVLATMFDTHTHATDHFAPRIFDALTGTTLRQFGPDAANMSVWFTADGARMATARGGGYAVWCR